MTESSNEREPVSASKYIRFDEEEWQRVEAAARKLAEELDMDIRPAEIVRSGTRKRVDEILGSPATT